MARRVGAFFLPHSKSNNNNNNNNYYYINNDNKSNSSPSFYVKNLKSVHTLRLFSN